MKRHLVRSLIAVLAFVLGVGYNRLASPGPAAKELTKLETFQRAPVQPVVVTPVTPPTPVQQAKDQAHFILDYNTKRFDPSGAYVLTKTPPKEFEEIGGFSIDIDDGSSSYPTEIRFFTDTGNDEPIKASFGLVTGSKLFFATRANSPDEVEYHFEGTFLYHGKMYESPEGATVLQGTLTKSKNGVKIAAKQLKFYMEVHGC